MSKVIYAKYNRTRDPRYQTVTKICSNDNGTRYVTKEPLTEEAVVHVLSFPKKAELSRDIFEGLKPIPVEILGKAARFPYEEGTRARNYLEQYSGDLTLLMDKIRELSERLFHVAPEKCDPFYPTAEFERVFGRINPKTELMAVRGLNVDMIFDNIILGEEESRVLDYEWTYEFPIPVEFALFRALFHYYDSNKALFADRISLEDYLVQLGIPRDLIEDYLSMEANFQFSVHGEGARFIYTGRYQKKTRKFPEEFVSRDRVSELEQEASMLRQEVQALKKSFSWKISSPVRMAAETAISLKDKAEKTRRMVYPEKIRQGLTYFKDNGMAATVVHTRDVLKGYLKAPYVFEEITPEEEADQRNRHFIYEPKISILVPLYNTPKKFLMEMIESVVNQTYPNWELCLADGSDRVNLRPVIGKYKKTDSRIKYMKLKTNGGISVNTNACIRMASGEFISLFDHDDLLTKDALYEVVKALNEKEGTDIVYTDEDKLLTGPKGQNRGFVEPHFKPDFNPDLLRTCNYICHFFVVRKTIVDEIGGFRKECDGSQDYDFILRCTEQSDHVVHIPRILYHWRIHANSTAGDPKNKLYCYESGKKALEDHLARRGVHGLVEMRDQYGYYKIDYTLKGNFSVSVIVVDKDRTGNLRACIDGISQNTSYSNYEILVVDKDDQESRDYYDSFGNEGRVRWLEPAEEEFNLPAYYNYGAEEAKGDYLIFIDSSIEILDPDWIQKMLANCQREEVGIVGPKFLSPDGRIENAGLIIGMNGIAGPAFAGAPGDAFGYNGRCISQQNLSAVSGACMMVPAAVYGQVGGMEEELKQAYYDVDLCLRIREKGYLIVMDPDVVICHHRTKSLEDQEPDIQEEWRKEESFARERWAELFDKGDPCYNVNLTLKDSDFSLKTKEEGKAGLSTV